MDTVACSSMARLEVLRKWKGNYISKLKENSVFPGATGGYATGENTSELYDCDHLKSNELVFLLLPFRHDINASSLVNNLVELNQKKEQLQMVCDT